MQALCSQFSGVSLQAPKQSRSGAGRVGCVSVQATAKRSRPAVEQVATFKRHATDTGSAEIQTALLTKRIENLTEHLKMHESDYACQRGLRMLLGQRTRLLRYVYNQNKQRYFDLVAELVRHVPNSRSPPSAAPAARLPPARA